MTRRRLWLATMTCCLLLALPTLTSLRWSLAPAALRALHWPTISLPAIAWGAWAVDLSSRAMAAIDTIRSGLERPAIAGSQWVLIGAIALSSLAVLTFGVAMRRRHANVPARVRRMSKSGIPVSQISRRTGLAQDAIRDLLQLAGRPGFASVLAATLHKHP